jgi:Holliday junction resolvase RusA-like endonuclease
MTQRDKWRVRPPVARYRAFCDMLRLHIKEIPACCCRVVFVMPMPSSWSKRKKAKMDGWPHQSARADLDNLLKAFLDAVHPTGDGHIWDIHPQKVWGPKGEVRVYL